MPNLYTVVARKGLTEPTLSEAEKLGVVYHDIFDYPLSFPELIKWTAGESFPGTSTDPQIAQKNGYFFIEGKVGIVYKRLLKRRISTKKLEIAKKAAEVLRLIPSVKMVAVTGSLAMENAGEESDIDLMIITKKGTLWTTRALTYLLISLSGLRFRRAGTRDEKDKLCLNIWFDESSLSWSNKDRNVYTAHEIGQIRPLVNKDKTYENFLRKNKWILRYWPNAVHIGGLGGKEKSKSGSLLSSFFEKIAFRIQYFYMKKKITREVVTPTRAIFHPHDWAKVVLSRLAP